MIIHLIGNDFLDTDTGIIETRDREIQTEEKPAKKVRKNQAKKGRSSLKVAAWRKAVLKRDKNTCQGCGAKEGLQVHHHARFSEIDSSAHDFIFNGITVCFECHAKLHPEMPEGFRNKFNKYVIPQKAA